MFEDVFRESPFIGLPYKIVPPNALRPEESDAVAIAGVTMRLLAAAITNPATSNGAAGLIEQLARPERTWAEYRQATRELILFCTERRLSDSVFDDGILNAIDDVRMFVWELHRQSRQHVEALGWHAEWLLTDAKLATFELPTVLLGFWQLVANKVDLDVALDLSDAPGLLTAGL